MALKYRGEIYVRFQEQIFYSREVEKVAQRHFVCCILGGIQGQNGWDPGQPDLWLAVLPMAGGLELGAI